MPNPPSGGKSAHGKLVEKQMRNWEISRGQRVTPEPDADRADGEEFVAVSRAVGSGGGHVARLLGEKLGWPVFDREILAEMAGDNQLRTRLYEQLDERDVSWLEDAIRWLVRGELRKDDFFYRLTETVLAINRQGHAVFLGRGVDLILPRQRGLRVRITASVDMRVNTLMARKNLSEQAARAEVERIDYTRREYIRNHFGREDEDATRCDLAFCMDHLSAEHAAEIILATLRLRGVIG